MNERNENQYRQGDVFLERVGSDTLDGAVVVAGTPRGVVLQEGTATGHAHVIGSKAARMMTLDGRRFLQVSGNEPVALTHEEHATLSIHPGCYSITIHAEYVPGELPRQVED